jgi:hypothetical protein
MDENRQDPRQLTHPLPEPENTAIIHSQKQRRYEQAFVEIPAS